MIGVLKKIWDFAGEEQGNIRKSMILGFFYAVFHMFQIAAIYVVVLALVGGSTDSAPAWQALGLLLASILGRAVLNRFSQLQQTHAGYFMVADKRISIGDKLKRVPMGYFNDQSLGELTGITTTVLDEVESTGPMVLVGILGGLINSAVMLLCVLFWDWRIGLLALAGMLVYLALLSGMEKQSAKIAPKRQRDEARLVEAVLEQLQGMSVIKSFNLTGKGDKRVRQALEDSRANNLAVEKLFTPYIWGQEMVLHLFSVLILAASVGLCLTEAMSLANALMAVIVSFLIFSQIQSAGSGVSALRLVGSSIDHANQVDDIPEMDQRGTAIRPESHEIVFDHVNFSYGSRPILKDVSLTIPDRTTTAIVGPSGSGKTTTILGTNERLRDKAGLRCAVIEGDIASDVDAITMKEAGMPAIQINTGGLCHLEGNMIMEAVDAFDQAVGLQNIDVIFIENVGNLVCPVDFDLGENLSIMILSVPEGDDKPIKYPGIFQHAGAQLLNKVDVAPAFDFDMDRYTKTLDDLNPQAPRFAVSARKGEGMDAWCDWLIGQIEQARA